MISRSDGDHAGEPPGRVSNWATGALAGLLLIVTGLLVSVTSAAGRAYLTVGAAPLIGESWATAIALTVGAAAAARAGVRSIRRDQARGGRRPLAAHVGIGMLVGWLAIALLCAVILFAWFIWFAISERVQDGH
jgi:hypothetical protein